MRILADPRRGLLALTAGLTALLTAAPVAAQSVRDVVSKSVSVGRDAASLQLEFEDGETLNVALADGRVRIDGEQIGTFQAGDALDAAWRTLLGFAVALDDGPLARTLTDWSPPDDLPDASADLALRIDDALEAAFLRAQPVPALPAVPEVAAAPAAPDASLALRSLVSLLDRTDALAGLAEALDDVDLDDVRLSVGEDLTIGDGEEVEGTVLVVDGDLDVAGRVRGDVVVVDGDIRLAPGGRIDGDVRYADGTVVDQGGRVDGEIVRVETVDRDMERRIRDELRSEIRNEIRAATRDRGDRGGSSIVGRAFGGVGGALGHLFTVLVVAFVGALVVHFAGPNLDAVAETARRTPGRAMVVGTAGAFLVLPAFVLGIVALAISIIGIPALILWIPLFPVAVVLGGGLGYLAVFRNLGVWVARQRFPYLGWVRITNPVTLVAGGALAVAAPSIAAELVSVFPWTGALEVVLRTTAFMLSAVVGLMGFGAVLLTRAGRKPEFFDDDLFGGWEPRRPRPGPGPDSAADESVWADVEAAADEVAEVVDEAMDAASEAAHDAVDAVDEALHHATDEVDDALDDAADAVDDALGDEWDARRGDSHD